MLLWDQLIDLLRMMIFAYAQACGGNLGAGVLAASMVVRIVMFPLTLRMARASMVHQQAMQRLQPELEAIRKRFRNHPERIAEESRKVFERHGVSPMPLAGCLSGLLQMPAFLAFYSAVRKAIAAGGRFLWIRNIAKPDVLLTIIVSAITYASVVYAASGSPPQHGKQIMAVLPVVVTVLILIKTSAGVGLYWGVSAAASLLQTFVVRRSSPLGRTC
jgi:YidC/Oxa1 family membrane protein insertase